MLEEPSPYAATSSMLALDPDFCSVSKSCTATFSSLAGSVLPLLVSNPLSIGEGGWDAGVGLVREPLRSLHGVDDRQSSVPGVQRTWAQHTRPGIEGRYQIARH